MPTIVFVLLQCWKMKASISPSGKADRDKLHNNKIRGVAIAQ